jgi:HD superfamily phosphodiesterase
MAVSFSCNVISNLFCHLLELRRGDDRQLRPQEWMQQTVSICAILHDVDDWKYEKVDSSQSPQKLSKRFLLEHHADEQLVELVEFVLANVGFKESLCGATSRPNGSPVAEQVLAIVQDADRLDALGKAIHGSD